jgi:tetratricopeptide (TPR) repeat protein
MTGDRMLPCARALALSTLLVGALANVGSAAVASARQAAAVDQEALDERELELARADADRLRRRGDPRAEGALRRLLSDAEDDYRTRALYARWLADQSRWDDALRQGRAALDAAPREDGEARGALGRTLLEVRLARAQWQEAVLLRQELGDALAPARDSRDAFWSAQVALAEGDRESSRALLAAGATASGTSWEQLWARARCLRALGDLGGASRALVEADRLAVAAGGAEPDVLAELASIYFEADGEIDHAQANTRSPGQLYRAALELHKSHEATLLGLFELGRFNWNRQRTPPHEYLERALTAAPNSVRALLLAGWNDLADGKLPAVRERVAALSQLAPQARGLRSLRAALAWVEHRREECRRLLGELAAEDAADSAPEREVGRSLNELYRFAEAVEFLRAAVARDATDHLAWMELGEALSNSGDEKGGLEALQRSEAEARGRQNAWRNNTRLVLERMQSKFVVEQGGGDLRYTWNPAGADVLRAYWLPFYESARTELAQRYAFTPGPTMIEVFERVGDFSVRSTGFEGFPALGVCFGPVVTAVAPHSEFRGRFSWARTAFHEFTHVIHLGLSHNRCPRWITEGLATWEEENKNPAWTRNLRRDLLDALHNDDLIAVRELNRAFRSSRIIFGYYQSGLLCRMWIETRGFPPMIALLEAFDRGADLDQALREVFKVTPEETDREFRAWVTKRVEGLALEPRWTPQVIVRKRVALKDAPPEGDEARKRWAEDWTTVAWGYHQQERRVDAEQALRRLDTLGLEPPRAAFLRGEMALARSEQSAAREHFERGLRAGGENFYARMVLGKVAQRERELERALEHFTAAEKAFPGYDDPALSAELHLAAVYKALERDEEHFQALERRLAWTADDLPNTLVVARWHAAEGRHERAAMWFERANDVDPFRRQLHADWGRSLLELARYADALREFRVALQVPPSLDPDSPDAPDEEEQAQLLGGQAQALVGLERFDEARECVEQALALDEDCENARRAQEELARRKP